MSDVKDYGMFSTAGNRLIHNRVETVRRNATKAAEGDHSSRYTRNAKIKEAVAKGVQGYAKMNSEKHGEHSDTEVRNCFLGAMESIYAKAAGVERYEASNFIGEVWNG